MSSPAQPSDDQPDTSPATRAESPLHPVSLLAGAVSAAVAAVIGGRLGLSGTVAGAAVGSIVAAVAATTVKHWVTRGGAAVVGVARRPWRGSRSRPNDTRGAVWPRRAVLAGGGFALGIVGLLAVQLAVGTSLSRGSGQLQEAATKVVAPTAAPIHRASIRITQTPSTATTPTAASSTTTSSPTTSPSAVRPVTTPSATASPTAGTTSTQPSTSPVVTAG